MFCPNLSDPEIKRKFESLKSVYPEGAYYLWDKFQGEVPAKYYNVPQRPISAGRQYQYVPSMSTTEIVASEKTLRDLAARMASRIGLPYKIISDRNEKFKGRIENGEAIINLAYASLDTPIHEILGHPIIRAIKNGIDVKYTEYLEESDADEILEPGQSFKKNNLIYELEYIASDGNRLFRYDHSKNIGQNNQLYQNLLKELETGVGKDVLDRVKRDYTVREQKPSILSEFSNYGVQIGDYLNVLIGHGHSIEKIVQKVSTEFPGVDWEYMHFNYPAYEPEFFGDEAPSPKTNLEAVYRALGVNTDGVLYTLEEQQEEAIVELLGLMTANKLDAVKDGKLMSLLKRLLKEMKLFMKQLLGLKEVEINNLPDNMTLGDLSDLLAYSNSKLILPGNEVIYTTPDNQQFKTYAEASKHISELAKSVEDVDLSNITVSTELTETEKEKIKVLEQEIQTLKKLYNSEEYKAETKEKLQTLEAEKDLILNKEIVFKDQEPNLNLEDKKKYEFNNFAYTRVQNTEGIRKGDHKEALGDYSGYYIFGYNVGGEGPDSKILKVTKEEAEEIWKKAFLLYPEGGFEYQDRQKLSRLYDSINDLKLGNKEKYAIQKLEYKIDKIKEGDTGGISSFIKRNKEYEQAKEIIEEWKKVNNIQYNPEEVYSRGQEFVSVVGAYSSFDVNLMMQNLLQHIEDNKKAGGEFTISVFTKPIDKNIGHLEGGGGKIKFKIYPTSQDIKWAANTDVYSGSVWDASKTISKDTKSELLGVSYSKYPSLSSISRVQPNLASIIDELNHHHNELGISLTGSNFRLEYDDDIPYSTKKIINSVNSILDQKYGKVVKPKIEKSNIKNKYVLYIPSLGGAVPKYFDTLEKAEEDYNSRKQLQPAIQPPKLVELKGIQPTQTDESTKSISMVSGTLDLGKVEGTPDFIDAEITKEEYESNITSRTDEEFRGLPKDIEPFKEHAIFEGNQYRYFDKEGNAYFRDVKSNGNSYSKRILKKEKQYTNQAIVNTKIAKLKEVAKKYPRSLIRSEVKPTDTNNYSSSSFEDFGDDLPFQKIRGEVKSGVSELFESNPELSKIGTPQQYSQYLDTLLPGGAIQYRGDQKGLSEFRYSTPSEESRKTGKVHKLGSGVYTTPNQSLAKDYANSNNGEVYPVLVSKGLSYNTRMDFLEAVAESLGIESIPTETQVDKFVKDQQDLGNSITVRELEETITSVKDSIPLNSPKVIEGFKQFVSKPSENVMYSRPGVREAVINALLTEDKFKDLLIKTTSLKLGGNPVTNREAVKDYVWEHVKSNLNYNGKFTIQGNIISILPSINVQDEEPKGVASKYARQLNKTYFSNVLEKSFFYKEIDGVHSVEFNPSRALLDAVANAVNRDQANEAIIAREIEAEIALINIAENAKEEHLGLLEKLASASEALIDGEVFPLDNSVFDSRIQLMRWTSRASTQSQAKVLDKLAERFPGVTWEWDTTIDTPGKVDLNSGKILVNPSLIDQETPWHEFGHIIVRMIKQSNPALFNLLKADVQRIHKLAPHISSQTHVEELYPEYIGTELFWEEAIVTELGRQSVEVYEAAAEYKESESLFQKIKNWLSNLLNDMLGKKANLNRATSISDLADILAGTESKFDKFKNQEAENAVSEFMFSRVLNAAQRDLLISQIKTPEGTTDYTEWGTKLKDLTSKIDIEEFRRLLFTNKFLNVDSIALDTAKKALSRIGDIITAEDVAEAVLELAEFYQYGAFYLSRLEANMKLIEEENKLPVAKQLSIFHNSYKQALAFEAYFNELQKLFKVGTRLPTNAEENKQTKEIGFLANAYSINAVITQIKKSHLERIEQPVAKILAENFKQSTDKLRNSFNEEIDRLTKLNTNGSFTKKIKRLEQERDEILATEENIIKFFKQKVNAVWLPQGIEKAKTTFLPQGFQWADTNITSNDPAVNIVGNFISDIIDESRAELIPVANTWQNLMTKMMQVEGNFAGTFIDVKKFFEPYYRKSYEYEVIDGELVKTKQVLVLNTPAKIQELQNKFTELHYIISTSQEEDKRNEAEDELKRLYEQYTERPFTNDYYELQKLLPEKVRSIRQEKFDLISALHETLVMEDDANSAQTIYRLKLANKELYDLERLYDDLGNLKTGEEREIAEAIIEWKEARREEVAIQYEISEESKGTYERELAKRKLIRDSNVADATTQAAKDAAIESYNNWTSVYSRTVYSEKFYTERETILNEIHKLLGKSTNTQVDQLYKEIFNALRGRKDKNNQYDARDITPEFTRTLKVKEEAIEVAKKSVKKSDLSVADKQKFFNLLEELEALQTSVPTEHYKDTVDALRASLRTQVVNQTPGLDIFSIEKEVENRFRKTQWYIDNHVTKVRWNKDTEQMNEVMEPIFMWRVTVPKNPSYILKEQPSFYWFKAKVNPKFKNPNYKPGEVNFKEITAGAYYNSDYDKLSPTQKSLLSEVRDAHYATQEGIYTRDKLYDKIPALEKSMGEIRLDTFRSNPIKQRFAKLKNVLTFNTENDPDAESEGIADQADVFGNNLDKSARRLFLRYSRALPLEEQSYDIMAAMSSYAASAVKFKTIRKYQSSLLSTEEVLSQLSGSESTRSKLIQSMMDRVVYGRARNKINSIGGKLVASVSSGVSRTAGSAVLGLNVKSVVKNWFNGYFTSWTQMQFNGLSKNDFAKAHMDTLGLSKEYFTEFAQFGKSSLKLQLVDYFAGLQHNPFNDAQNVSNVGFRKYGKLWKSIASVRAYSEFDIAANIVFAFLNKHRVPLKGSTQTIPLKEAFTQKNGVITLRDDVDVSADFIAHIRREIKDANVRSQGAYDDIAQPELVKYAAAKMALWMKRYMIQHLKVTWGGDSIHYGAGIRTVGAHKAVFNVMRDLYSTQSFAGISNHDKAGILQLGKSYAGYIVLANMIKAMSSIGNCEDDGVADWKDHVCFYLKSILSEVEGVFTFWGMNEFLNTHYQERANNVSVMERIGSIIGGPSSVISNWLDSDLWTTDPYYKYKPNSTKVDWDRTHPLMAGKPGIQVLGLKILGAAGTSIDNTTMEYDNRKFNAFTPKTYTKQLTTEFTEDYKGVKERLSRTPMGQVKKAFKKEVLEIKREILEAQKRNEDLTPLFNKLREAQQNAMQAAQNVRTTKKKNFSIDVLPTPFWKRKGMDLEEMADDIE